MPAFTSKGYKKIKIPISLFQLIYNSQTSNGLSFEDCLADDPMFNCQRIKHTNVIGKFNICNRYCSKIKEG